MFDSPEIASMVADLPVPHDDGSFVSAKVSRVVEAIRDYDRNLDVRWMPPAQRGPGDNAFMIIHTDPNGREQVVMYVRTEEEMDERVPGRIYAADKQGADVTNAIEAQNRAVRELKQRRFQESMAEANDLARAMLRSGKHEYNHNGRKIQL